MALEIAPDPPVDKYNRLLHLKAASAELEAQLKEAGISRTFLFDSLVDDLFSDVVLNPQGKYGVWLMHRHYRLQPDERMVTESQTLANETTRQQITSPKPKGKDLKSPPVERWLMDSTAAEFCQPGSLLGDDTDEPSSEFFSKFQGIVGTYNITVLGVCRSVKTNELSEGEVYVETAYNVNKRQQKTEIQLASYANGDNYYETSWFLVSPSNAMQSNGFTQNHAVQLRSMWGCIHVCNNDH